MFLAKFRNPLLLIEFFMVAKSLGLKLKSTREIIQSKMDYAQAKEYFAQAKEIFA